MLYEYGCGVEVNYAKALEYYQEAADKDDTDAVDKVTELREKLNGS